MTTHFNYWLTGVGWAEVTFANDKQSISFEFSYLSDPLADLLVALHRLAIDETQQEKVFFTEEPGEHSLILTKQDDKLKIEIFWRDQWESLATVPNIVTDKELVYSDTDTFNNFTKTVLAGLQDLLDRTSLSEYKTQWHLSEFPVDSYNKLKKVLGEIV